MENTKSQTKGRRVGKDTAYGLFTNGKAQMAHILLMCALNELEHLRNAKVNKIGRRK